MMINTAMLARPETRRQVKTCVYEGRFASGVPIGIGGRSRSLAEHLQELGHDP